MFKKAKQAVKQKVQKIRNGMPGKQRELVFQIHDLISSKGYKFFAAQHVTNLAMAAITSGEESAKALQTATEITKMMEDAGVTDKVHQQAILQVLTMKINESINQMDMSDIELNPIED